MRGVLTVSVADPAIAPAVAEIVSSLPVSFAWAAEPDQADVMVVDGSGGWVAGATAALGTAAIAVVILDPTVTDADSVRTLASAADTAGISVVLSESVAGSPALEELAARRPDLVEAYAAFTGIASSAHVAQIDQILSGVRAIRAFTGHGVALDAAYEGVGSVIVTGALRGTTRAAHVSFIASRGTAVTDALRWRGYGTEASILIDLPSSETARPAEIALTELSQEVRLPSIYESAHRARWRTLASRVDRTGAAENDVLRVFADDLAELAKARTFLTSTITI